MLKHLPENSLETLLNIFNYIWTTGKFPEDWTLATIIPIPKPGKDPAEPNNYRPIALTGCLCKTLERMMDRGLTWFLESNNHISRFQSGFRSDRGATDNLVGLETFIRDAFIGKEHVVAVFFDLEKALKEWKINIFKIIDTRISFYSRNTHLLPPEPKSSFRHLKRGIQEFHMNYVLVPADKAANNVVVV